MGLIIHSLSLSSTFSSHNSYFSLVFLYDDWTGFYECIWGLLALLWIYTDRFPLSWVYDDGFSFLKNTHCRFLPTFRNIEQRFHHFHEYTITFMPFYGCHLHLRWSIGCIAPPTLLKLQLLLFFLAGYATPNHRTVIKVILSDLSLIKLQI